MSHARAHYLRASASATQAAASPQEQTTGNAYELMLAKLAQDRRRLKEIQSQERKAEVKAQLLPEYWPWIEGVLTGDSGRQDDVLMTVLVWCIDIGDFTNALRIGRYAVEHGLVMPDQYKRDVPTVLAEEFADQSLKALAANTVADLDALQAIAELTAGKDMPDEVRAKLYKAIGYTLRSAGQLAEAKEALERALILHDKVGVKKDIERLETAIKNSAKAPEGQG